MPDGVADIKATLARLEPMIIKLVSDVADIKGRLADMPSSRDFGKLEGRIAEQSSILQVAIASRMTRGKPNAA